MSVAPESFVVDTPLEELRSGALASRSVLRVVDAVPSEEERREAIAPYSGEAREFDSELFVEKVLRAAVKGVFSLIACGVMIIAGLLIGYSTAPETTIVVVQPGDSLYSIAASLPEAPSIERAIDDMRSINALPSDNLAVGQRILVPEY